MAYDFPGAPTDGQTFSPAGGPDYIYRTASGAWEIKTSGSNSAFVAKAGDVMTGALVNNSTVSAAASSGFLLGTNVALKASAPTVHALYDTSARAVVSVDGPNKQLYFDADALVFRTTLGAANLGSWNATKLAVNNQLAVAAGSAGASVSQLSFAPASGTGGYLLATTPGQALVSGGAEFVGGSWIARHTDALYFGGQSGQFDIGLNTGLTIGGSVPWTTRFTVKTTGVSIPGTYQFAGVDVLRNNANYFTLCNNGGVAIITAGPPATDATTYYDNTKHVFRVAGGGSSYATWDSAKLTITSATSSSSPTTGALVIPNGGLGVGGNIYAGGIAQFGSSLAAVPGFGAALLVGYEGGGSRYGMAMRPATDGTYAIIFCNAAGTNIGSITQTATNITVNGQASDIRLKEDMQPSFDAGPILDALTIYDFAWKSTGERAHGVAAQEAIEVYPLAITHMEREDWWGVDYTKYVPLLLQEVKALRAANSKYVPLLLAELKALRARVAELEARKG